MQEAKADHPWQALPVGRLLNMGRSTGIALANSSELRQGSKLEYKDIRGRLVELIIHRGA